MSGGRHVSASGLKFWVESHGSGPTVLLITGLGYASWFWKQLSEALGSHHHVICFDNRGTGRSDKPEGPYSMAMLADDAASILTACGVSRAHVIGHSMGGYITQTLARRHADRVQSMVLVSTAAGGPDCLPVPAETLEIWSRASSLPPSEHARMSMPLSFAPGWTEQNPQAFEAYLKHRLEFPTPAECWRAQFQACEKFFEDNPLDQPPIQARSLVVHGTEDRVLPFANGELLARGLPNAQFQRLDGAGHLPPLEDPENFAGIVREFLRIT